MKDKLTLKQQRFCDYYLEGFGNATEAVIKAGYNVSRKNGTIDRNLAKSIASENLTKPDISAYIGSKLEESGFNDNNATKQHLFLLNQFTDLSAKNKAIDMYYRLTGKYKATKIEVRPFEGWTPTELYNYAKKDIVPERFKDM